MNAFAAIIVYLLIWWTTLFACLPLGRVHEGQNQKGAMPGAPTRTNLKRVLIVNTLVAAVIWGIVYALAQSDMISFQRMVSGRP